MPNIIMSPPQVYLCSPSWTLLPPPSPYHPSGSSQCTSPKHPVSCIKHGLATRFIHDILHVSMPFSQLWCWRRLLRVPWTARRSNQSILKEVNPEYSLEGLMLKLKLPYFYHDAKSWLIGKDWCWERLGARGEWSGATDDEMVGWHD